MSDIYTHWTKEDLEKEAERLCEENEKLKRRIQLFKNTRNEQVFAKLADAYEKIEKMQEVIDALVPVYFEIHTKGLEEGYKCIADFKLVEVK